MYSGFCFHILINESLFKSKVEKVEWNIYLLVNINKSQMSK